MNITVEMLQRMSLVALIAAGVFFVVAAILFFLLDIPKVIGDVTGSTARKEIELLRQQNEQSGNKAYKPSQVNRARGKITDKISPSGNLYQREVNPYGVAVGTADLENTPPIANATDETTVLDTHNQDGMYWHTGDTDPDEDYEMQQEPDMEYEESGPEYDEPYVETLETEYTHLEQENDSSVYGFGDTTVLGSNETTVLGQTDNDQFYVIEEIEYSSSQEIIE